MYDALTSASTFAVNILAAGQEHIARRFADLGDQRFMGVGFTRGECGAAILDDVLAVLECRRATQHVVGDHTIVIGEVERVTVRDEKPLLYYRGGFAQIDR
jgi:flavin reductase (DIM6/NTAB) family NADH-FMN oxidoreductase RutF